MRVAIALGLKLSKGAMPIAPFSMMAHLLGLVDDLVLFYV